MIEEKNIIQEKDYYLFYQMMMESLKKDNVIDGISDSFSLLKDYINCDDVVLFEKNEHGIYSHFANQNGMEDLVEPIGCIVNKTSNLIESKKIFSIGLNLSDKLKNVTALKVDTKANNYILAINNLKSNYKDNEIFFKKVAETIEIILKRYEMYKNNTTAINIDKLTGLKNRNAYESMMEKNDNSKNLVFGIFDLFRLKYVNDNYSHQLGDRYIIEVAKILSKYWPEYDIEIEHNGTYRKIATGHNLYRIGGDEFVLVTNNERVDLTKIKAQLAGCEAELINLIEDDSLKLGLNCGIITTCNKSLKDAYIEADEIMQEDKRRMYTKYGVERRR